MKMHKDFPEDAAEVRVFNGVCHGIASLLGLVAKAAQAVEYAGARLKDAFVSSM